MKNLLLTSYLAGTLTQFEKFMSHQKASGKEILFIDTASQVESYTKYIDEALIALSQLNYTVDRLDVASADIARSKAKIQNANIIFVAGGNTFYLLDALKKTALDQLLIKKINHGTPYIGESAGAVILSPDITYIQQMDDPGLAPRLKNYEGLGITRFSVLPHYLDIPFETESVAITNAYQQTIDLVMINNHETITVINHDFVIHST